MKRGFTILGQGFIAATVLVFAATAGAELIDAGGNVTLIVGTEYFPVKQASDGLTTTTWVTQDPGGYPSDYLAVAPAPVLAFDLGRDVILDGVAYCNYTTANTNGVSQFSLRFATEADGPTGFGKSVSFHPRFTVQFLDPSVKQPLPFGTVFAARYIEMTCEDNFYNPENPWIGGDRVGFAELQFNRIGHKAWNPGPAQDAQAVALDVTLRWNSIVVQNPADPNTVIADPALKKHVVYMSNGSPTDPNVVLLAEVPAGDPVGAQAQYGPLSLARDKIYYWRVDEVTDANTVEGDIWKFETLLSTPVVGASTPADLLVASGQDAMFVVTATNPFTGDSTGLGYQWYKVGTPDAPMGADSAALTIANAQRADEGRYYCRVTIIANGATADSRQAGLMIKRRIAYFPFDGNADDIDGEADGISVGTPDFEAEGIVGGSKAVSLNGTSYIRAPFSAFAWSPENSFSVSLWANVTGGAGSYRAAISNRHEPPTQGFILYAQDSNTWAFWTGQISGWNGLGGPAVTLNQWVHLAITCEVTGDDPGGSKLATKKLYVNGVLASQSQNALYLPKTIGSDLFIGAGQNESPANFFFDGRIDDVRIYNYPVSAVEVAQLYTDVVGGTVCMARPVGDFDADCAVTLADFALLASEWIECNLVPVTACP